MNQCPYINFIGISGGKDSTALLLWAIHESGYPKESVIAGFCDTRNEAQLTYDYIYMLSEKVHPIEWITPPLDFYKLSFKKGRFPSTKARFCTQELKMKPTQVFIRKLLQQGHSVLNHSGVRAEESPQRAKLSETDFDWFMGVPVFRPLLMWTLKEVWVIHERYGIPPNPLYGLGSSRVGCFPCINSSKHEIRMIAGKFPERINMIHKMEESFTNSNKNSFSSFFSRDKVPKSQRSKEIVTASGEIVKVPTINDVVRWSKTKRGGKQYLLDFEGYISEDKFLACPNSLGVCE